MIRKGPMMATETPEIDFGQVWANGDKLALVRDVGPLERQPDRTVAHMTEIVDGRAEGTRIAADIVDGVPRFNGPWALQGSFPWVRCLGNASAEQLAGFLRGKGLHDVLVNGDRVAVSITPPSVISMAEDAVEHGWATDHEAAQAIARLG
jgi:hypothetical protein